MFWPPCSSELNQTGEYKISDKDSAFWQLLNSFQLCNKSTQNGFRSSCVMRNAYPSPREIVLQIQYLIDYSR